MRSYLKVPPRRPSPNPLGTTTDLETNLIDEAHHHLIGRNVLLRFDHLENEDLLWIEARATMPGLALVLIARPADPTDRSDLPTPNRTAAWRAESPSDEAYKPVTANSQSARSGHRSLL